MKSGAMCTRMGHVCDACSSSPKASRLSPGMPQPHAAKNDTPSDSKSVAPSGSRRDAVGLAATPETWLMCVCKVLVAISVQEQQRATPPTASQQCPRGILAQPQPVFGTPLRFVFASSKNSKKSAAWWDEVLATSSSSWRCSFESSAFWQAALIQVMPAGSRALWQVGRHFMIRTVHHFLW